MDFVHISLFRDIVYRRSVTRGAKDHGVTQSAASQVVQEFERALGVRLLDRSRRPLQVTDAGRLFYEFAAEVLDRHQRFLADLQGLRSEPTGVVRVASIYSVGLAEMSRLEEAFKARLPRGRLEVDFLRPEMVHASVVDGKADIGLMSYPKAGPGIVSLDWRQDALVVAAAPPHPLARLTRIRLAALDQQEFIGFNEDLPISRHIDRLLKEAGVQVRCRLRFDNIQSLKEALQTGRAVAILPAPMLEGVDGRLRGIRLVPTPYRPLGIVHREGPLTNAARIFLEVLEKPSERRGRERR
jgi:LysR family transcriptional regulator, transcriptional activator of the cysJI operon